ncbi:hypothetical protein ACQP1O_20430 [Nocardia sp. CA-151230]|uniref:hypothetical protein n=1 Tax=Nocardia sp. CA-151230 TaxID=3239982 RepID=UPI003D8BE2B7
MRSSLAVVAAALTVGLVVQAPIALADTGSSASGSVSGSASGSGDLWVVPTASADKFTFLVAYSFGNRIPAGADPTRTEGEPGPVNEALAAAVVAARGTRTIPVYAQTSIADVLRTEYGMTDVIAIEADRQPDGTLTYLSTDGVAKKVSALRGTAQATDVAGVIAFKDHLWRATYTTRNNGLRAYAPAGITMPSQYDPQSGQAWTTSALAYLPVDMAARIPLLLNGTGSSR